MLSNEALLKKTSMQDKADSMIIKYLKSSPLNAHRMPHSIEICNWPTIKLSFGDIAAMAGDYFEESIHDEVSYINAIDLSNNGRLPIQIPDIPFRKPRLFCHSAGGAKAAYVFIKKLHTEQAHAFEVEPDVEARAERIFMELALNNHTHFLKPELTDNSPTIECPEAYSELPNSRKTEHTSAWDRYAYYHCKALRTIFQRGKRSVNSFSDVWDAPYFDGVEPMILEAFAQHYLSDAFAAAHIIVPRRELQRKWNTNLATKLAGYLAHGLRPHLEGLNALASEYTVRVKLMEVFSAGGISGMTLGDLISGALHDYYNKYGIDAQIQGKIVRLFGDGELLNNRIASQTAQIVSHALATSLDDIDLAVIFHRNGKDYFDLIEELRKRNRSKCGATFLVQCMYPSAIKSEAWPWEHEDVTSLLSDKKIVDALRQAAPSYGDQFKRRCPKEYRKAIDSLIVNRLIADPRSLISDLIAQP